MVETVQPSTSTQPNVAHMTEVEQYVANIMFLQNGQKSTLLVRGTSVENVHKNLVKENTKDGIIQIKVEGIKAISSVLKGIEKKKWSVDELINFTNRYTSLLKVKLAPQDILENMYREGGEPVLLQLLYVCVGKSKFLDEAMETMPGVFPKDYCGIIKASRSLADMYGIMKEISLLLSIKKKIYGNITNIRNALLIPVVAISGIMFATSLYVTPLMIQMYDGFHQRDALPTSTMTVFAMANFFIAYALYILGIIVAAISPVVYKYTTDENWRYIIDETILGLPIIGKPLSVYYEIQFLRIISLAKKAKLPDIEAFELARESQTNLLYKNMLENIQKALRRSEDLSTVFAQNPYLSEDVSQIYKLAVKSNSIADMFLQLAESKEEHIGYMLTNAEKYADIANKFIISGLAIAMAYMFYFPLLQVSTIATQGASKM